MVSTQIKTALKPDAPLVLTADYQINSKADRQYIDGQILGIEELITNELLRGQLGTWFKAGVTLAVGDVACAAPSPADEGNGVDVVRTCTLATTAAMATAGAALGVVVAGATAGSWVRVAMFGVLGASVTGLGVTAGFVRVSTVGRCEYVSSYTVADFPIGTVDGAGNLSVRAERAVITTVGGGVGTTGYYLPADVVITSTNSLTGLGVIDGVTPVAGVTRIAYVVNGTTAGIYVAAIGPWPRASDMDADSEVVPGYTVFITGGTLGVGTWWQLLSGATIAGAKTYQKLVGNPDTVVSLQGAITELGHDERTGTIGRMYSGSRYGGDLSVTLAVGSTATVWKWTGAALGLVAGDQVDLAGNVNAKWASDGKKVWAHRSCVVTHGTPPVVEEQSSQDTKGNLGAGWFVMSWVQVGNDVELQVTNTRTGAGTCKFVCAVNFWATEL